MNSEVRIYGFCVPNAMLPRVPPRPRCCHGALLARRCGTLRPTARRFWYSNYSQIVMDYRVWLFIEPSIFWEPNSVWKLNCRVKSYYIYIYTFFFLVESYLDQRHWGHRINYNMYIYTGDLFGIFYAIMRF